MVSRSTFFGLANETAKEVRLSENEVGHPGENCQGIRRYAGKKGSQNPRGANRQRPYLRPVLGQSSRIAETKEPLLSRIILTNHALKRMKERGVPRWQVERTIFEPDGAVQPGEFDEEIAYRRFGNREIGVVFEETKRDVIIVYTVFVRRLRQ